VLSFSSVVRSYKKGFLASDRPSLRESSLFKSPFLALPFFLTAANIQKKHTSKMLVLTECAPMPALLIVRVIAEFLREGGSSSADLDKHVDIAPRGRFDERAPNGQFFRRSMA